MKNAPRLGQNFLRDSNAIRRIAASLGPLEGRTVVEIGPGQGAITDLLADSASRLIAVELDPLLARMIEARFPPERVTVVERDVLQFDFEAAAREAGGPLLVVGNLPYYITSPILLKLAAQWRAIDTAVLMVQREVAERVTAHPNSRDYGLLSVTVQLFGPAQMLFHLPPEAFSPPPKVESTVFRWRFAPRFEELRIEPQPFLAFVRKAFAQKRKTLANNLRAAGFAPVPLAKALTEAAVEPNLRAEALPIEQLAALFRALEPQTPQG